MGGGGAMRAAAKVAGINIFSNSFRTTPTAAENPVTVAARKAVRPVCSGLNSIALSSDDQISAQKAVWEFDDWEFSGSEDELVVDKNNTDNPRRVFGPVPTLDETREATDQLKDALDQVYLSSPKASGTPESVSDAHETKACITHESSTSKNALQAFKLLKESPAVQSVVASIACDPNVWHAVMQNPSLMEFLESEKKSTMFESPNFHRQEFPEGSSVDSSDSSKPDPDGLMAFLENVKVTVVDVVQYLTNLVESWFSSPKEGQKEGYVDEKFSQNYFAGGSFMALAMMVIMVVVLNR